MKKLNVFIFGVVLGFVCVFGIAQAAQPALTVFQGGTGSTTPSGILIGDNGATPRLSTLIIGSNLTLSGTTLSAAGGSGTYSFTPGTFGGTNTSATSTALNDSAGFISIASSTLYSLTMLFSTTTNATTSELALVGTAKACNGANALTTSAAGNVTCTAQPQGTVTAVSVASANGFAGSSGGGATPALTLTTTITGLLKGNGTAISAAALTDFPSQGANTVIANGTGAGAVPTAVATSSLFQNASATLSGLLTSTDWTTFNNKVATSRSLTIAGTANQISLSAGAQDLSADRTWTVSIPADFRVSSTTLGTKTLLTNATTTTFAVLDLSAASCDVKSTTAGILFCGTDATTAGANPFTWVSNFGVTAAATTSALWAQSGIFASSTSFFGPATTTFNGDVKIATTSSTALNVRTNAGLVNFNIDNTATGGAKWGVGTSSPFAALSVHANNGDTAITLFNIGSSTATATTSLFSVSNIGSTTLFQVPSSLISTDAGGALIKTAIGQGVTFSSNALSIANNGLTLAMLPQVSANRLLGNASGAAANAAEVATTSLYSGTVGMLPYFSGTGALVGTSSLTLTTGGLFGIGSTTPWAWLSISPNGTAAPAFAIGSSSSQTQFQVTSGGQTGVCESKYGYGPTAATSTTITLDWINTCNTVTINIGNAATTVTLINATTSNMTGSRKLVEVCNPTQAAGAITWKGVEWIGGTTPSQTTTSNQCDDWSFWVGSATSTILAPAYKVHGAMSAGFQ